MSFPGLEIRSNRHLLQDLVVGQSLLVQDPYMLLVAGLIIPSKRSPGIRSIENCGTVSVYWRIGAAPTPDVFHGTLKACVVADDGTGGFVDLSRVQGPVYIAPTTGSTCRVVRFEALSPEGQS